MTSSVVIKSIRVLIRLPRQAQPNVVQTRKFVKMDPAGLVQRHVPSPHASKFFDRLYRNRFNNDGDYFSVLDVGCGAGAMTKHVFLPMFPNAIKCVGIDVLPEMIEYAEKHYPHPKIEYKLADIEDWNSLKEWEGVFTKLIAIDTFQWVRDQRLAFQNIYKLLDFGGEAAIYMGLQCKYFDAMKKICKDYKWSSYLGNLDEDFFIAVPHKKSYHRGYYEKMADEFGFTIDFSEENLTVEPFPHDYACRNYLSAICGLVDFIPDYRKEEFRDDLFWYVVNETGRTYDGRPLHIGATLELLMRKGT